MLMDPFFSQVMFDGLFFASASYMFYPSVHVHCAFNMVMNNNLGLVITILVLLVELL
jgi:hypothetical protein